jgi:dUTP pyrophosphatase
MTVFEHFSGQGVLSREAIQQLLAGTPPLLADLPDVAQQLQPNGVDITLERVARLRGRGQLGRVNAERVLPEVEDLPWDADGALDLAPGTYHVRFNETVNLPNWLMAYARPRSSLLRSGVALHTAVWDAGYSGRGTSLLVVYHSDGFRVARDARICQLVFHCLTAPAGEGYSGAYQHEGATRG